MTIGADCEATDCQHPSGGRLTTMDRDGTVLSSTAPAYADATWGPYYDALYPQRRVHFTVQWKAVPGWIDRAVELWRRREVLRVAYEVEHGSDRDLWPSRHPGIALEDCAACLGCQWIVANGILGAHGIQQWTRELARHHEISHGTTHGESR